MTCGIYKLVFEGTNKCYIGQSVNIEKRFTQHIVSLQTGKASKKLLDAYKVYGVPTLFILKSCGTCELDEAEIYYIKEFSSVENGFNTYSTPYEFITFNGTEAANAKYSESLIVDTLMYLCIPGSSVSKAEVEFGIKAASVSAILAQKQHLWVFERYPELLKLARENTAITNKQTISNNPKLLYNYSAKYGSPVKVLDSNNTVYDVYNINEFSRHHDISKSSLHRLISKQVAQTRGWRLACPDDQA